MNLQGLKTLLGIPAEDTTQDERLALLMAAAVDYVRQDLGVYFELFKNPDTGLLELPALVKLGIAKLVENVDRDPAVKSESIGGLSQTFDNNTAGTIASIYFAPFRRSFGFLPARRIPPANEDIYVLPAPLGGDLDGR